MAIKETQWQTWWPIPSHQKGRIHIILSQIGQKHGIKSILFSMNDFFIPTTKINSPLKNKHLHLLPKSSPVLKKPKWNTLLTQNASRTWFTILFTGKDFHEKKINGFPLKNLLYSNSNQRIPLFKPWYTLTCHQNQENEYWFQRHSMYLSYLPKNSYSLAFPSFSDARV